MGQFSKPWNELTFADNFIFCKVMLDEELCKKFIEILLGIKVAKIEYLNTENQIENYYDSHGVRLDVYVKDSDRIFDIEIQTGDYDDLLLRARYYQGASDVATTKRRT
ncbi:MAG: Rpn family recombination-promoting nuclease/putative transposase, partial [Treponema sp.]|nr:Rpn family recombination-promoting nuclease/putative transposase [Treponema sp.]